MVEEILLSDADRHFQEQDFRWFFTYAHARITQQINANLERFDEPNDLMMLNIHFAEEFLRALNGQAHAAWRRAFAVCEALRRNSEVNPFLVGEIELCGAAMANVHIHVDLTRALDDVGCITPRDYGNMLAFVNRGALAAQVRLRGRFLGVTEAIASWMAAPWVDLELKAWRNAAYQRVCNTRVPDPDLRL